MSKLTNAEVRTILEDAILMQTDDLNDNIVNMDSLASMVADELEPQADKLADEASDENDLTEKITDELAPEIKNKIQQILPYVVSEVPFKEALLNEATVAIATWLDDKLGNHRLDFEEVDDAAVEKTAQKIAEDDDFVEDAKTAFVDGGGVEDAEDVVADTTSSDDFILAAERLIDLDEFHDDLVEIATNDVMTEEDVTDRELAFSIFNALPLSELVGADDNYYGLLAEHDYPFEDIEEDPELDITKSAVINMLLPRLMGYVNDATESLYGTPTKLVTPEEVAQWYIEFAVDDMYVGDVQNESAEFDNENDAIMNYLDEYVDGTEAIGVLRFQLMTHQAVITERAISALVDLFNQNHSQYGDLDLNEFQARISQMDLETKLVKAVDNFDEFMADEFADETED